LTTPHPPPFSRGIPFSDPLIRGQLADFFVEPSLPRDRFPPLALLLLVGFFQFPLSQPFFPNTASLHQSGAHFRPSFINYVLLCSFSSYCQGTFPGAQSPFPSGAPPIHSSKIPDFFPRRRLFSPRRCSPPPLLFFSQRCHIFFISRSTKKVPNLLSAGPFPNLS